MVETPALGRQPVRQSDRRPDRLVAMALVALATVYMSPTPAQAQATGAAGGFIELTDVFFSEGDRIFVAGEQITVSGSIPFIPSYLCPPGGDGEDRLDFFPAADIYVIENQPLGLFAPLNDVLDTPNRIIGTASGGAFVEETVAIVKPNGNLGAGEYDIVMDQCNDGGFDIGIDIHLGAGPGFALKVFLPEDLGEIDLAPIKESAKKSLLALEGFEIPEAIAAATGVPSKVPGVCGGLGELVDLGQKLNQVPAGLANAAAFAIELCDDLVAHYKGLVADPPDPNVTEFAELGQIPYSFFTGATRFERALLGLSNVIVEQEAITEAFLTTLERVQGAQQAGDHEFLSLQLKHLNEFINLLVGPGGNLLRFFAALEALDRAVRDKPGFAGAPETEAYLRTSAEMRRAIGEIFFALGPRFKRDPSDPNALIPFGLQSWIITYLGLDPFLNTAGLFSIAEFRAASGLPPIDFRHPEAKSTGPYTAPPGRDVSFDALPSTDPNGDALTYAWDLDMDGQFDDGAAQLVEQSFAEPGTRLVGLKVTDPAGNSDVAYIQLKIGDTTVQDIISIQHLPRDLKRITPDGTVTTIKEGAIPGSGRPPLALQVDVDDSIFILDATVLNEGGETRPIIHHLDANGEPIATATPDDIEALIGREISQVHDMRLDGRGDLLLTANVEGPNATGAIDPDFGPLMVIRLARDFSVATIIAEGILRLSSSQPTLAIDPEGKIVLADVGHPDAAENSVRKGEAGVSVLDPDDGDVVQTVPANRALLNDDRSTSVVLLFGGAPLGLFNLAGPRGQGGIEVDAQGNYITGHGTSFPPPRLWRVPAPPEVVDRGETATSISLGLEVFPLLPGGVGTLDLSLTDIAIDAGGDIILVGRNTGDVAPFNHNSVWRVSPVSETFFVADLGVHARGTNQGGFAFDVTRELRNVTPRDVPALSPVPELRLDSLEVDQVDCPLSATVRATLTNVGAADVTDPIQVFIFEGDPLTDGVVIGTAVAPAPIAPGASVQLAIPWPDPAPGVHQVFALGRGTNVPFSAAMICVPAPPDEAIVLRPLDATLDVGETHTVTGRVFDLYGDPIPGLDLTFSVDGANPTTGTGTTDATGTATFSYSGAAPGRDTIGATVFDEVSNPATARWARACIGDLATRAKRGKVQLTWTHTGAAQYHVYRSTTMGGPYMFIAATTSTFSTYLDMEVANGTTYYYVVREATLNGDELCQSNEASATPRTRMRRR